MRNPAVLALASLAALGSATAHAGVQTNGPLFNGAQINGAQINGAQINGAQINGAQINGTNMSVSVVGFASTCPHREDVTGAAMPGSCSPCAQAVVNSDPYCANNYWDYYCVNGWDAVHQGTKGYCTLDSTELVGQKFKVTFPDGGWAQVRLDRVDRGSTATWNGSQYLNMSDVYYHTLSYTCSHAATVQGAPLSSACSSTAQNVCASDSYCCSTYWDGLCVAEASSWAGANKAAKGAAGGVCSGSGRGIFVAGLWDQVNIGRYKGAGGKISWSRSNFTFGCESNGAVAKCVNFGYKPWASSTQDTLHQTCIRMVRNDVCGDGTPWTQDGTQIFVEDWTGIQDGDFCWSFLEATWNTLGGCPYYMPWRSTYSGMNYSTYRNSGHSYCPDPNGVHPECVPDLNSTSRLMWDALWVPCEG